MFQSKLIYIHDPMCSWCWGYAPTWLKLKEQLEHRIIVEYKVGGLAADSQQPMPKAMKEMLVETWHKIQKQLGIQFNYDFWRNCEPRRSTYPACRAALIARKTNKEAQMIEAIQHAYYLNAQNPSDEITLVELAEGIGFEKTAFADELASLSLNNELSDELNFIKTLPINGFPSLVLIHNNSYYPIAVDYTDWQSTYDKITSIID
ncbi:DsbA family protein [Pseudoalteromonas sp. 10-33]|uniref:DsbA family protein n=1 Tax=Pseudoalteromonas sp. 10-33 TaxID=1761890 RepID=UPI0007321A7E|nr:DsbA family protein [Pseudoalteromonas sp. 10-33]KTF11517.1 thioredoxin [Pseudoalteromonas sp. 10-33]